MTFFTRLALMPTILLGAMSSIGAAFAGGPEPNAIGFQPPATLTMERIAEFHNILLWLITVITVFVMVLMIYVMVRFREKANPNPSKTAHNTVIEVAWTVIPIVILLVIAIPSMKLLYFQDRAPEEKVEMTIKAIGKQWYWTYEYPDHGNFTFDATMTAKADIPEGLEHRYLLETDVEVVLPVETTIRILVTAGDVLHNFAVPAFGVKLDGVPGRINETWMKVPAEFAGEIFYGQCSELCGVGHSFMPIKVRMVSKEEYAEWVAWAQNEYARLDSPENRVSVANAAAAAQ